MAVRKFDFHFCELRDTFEKWWRWAASSGFYCGYINNILEKQAASIFYFFQTCCIAGKDASFTVGQQDESDFLQASENPFNNDNTTVCKCKPGKCMCLREGGRNAYPCKNSGHPCSSACHGQEVKACLNRTCLLLGDFLYLLKILWYELYN